MTPRVVVPARSPLTQRGWVSSPSTPTPAQRKGADYKRRDIPGDEYGEKAPLRSAKIFDELRPFLRDTNTLLSFEWKEDKRHAKLVPVP